MEIANVLGSGPVLGRELYERMGLDVFTLWKLCHTDDRILTETIDTPYLRFDSKVEGHARLSPSLERQFLSYTAVGLKGDKGRVQKLADLLEDRIRKISEEKMRTAEQAVESVMEQLREHREATEKSACFLIGGDVPLHMAHADPRPEKSTDEMVAGSDLDIIVILDDDFPLPLEEQLDSAIYNVKHQLLKRPLRKEEIDYIIKRFSRVAGQSAFNSFEHRIACKIIDESRFLWGSEDIYGQVKDLLKKNGVPAKLKGLKSSAAKYRKSVVKKLLDMDELSEDAYTSLFTTTDEFGEIF